MALKRPIRLCVVLTHPIQYYAPWFRHIAAACPALELSVLYITEPTPEQQGVGFERPFRWDVPLTEGYRSRVLRPAQPGDDFDARARPGIDSAEIEPALRDLAPDVVLVPGWHAAGLRRAREACQRRGIPVLYRGDSTLAAAPRHGVRRRAWHAATRFRLGRYSAWLATGRRSREYLLAHGARAERIFAAPHCVDNAFFAAGMAAAGGRSVARAHFGLPPEAFVVLFAGKLIEEKRPEDLIRAMPLLPAGARLLVVGSGPLEGACRREAEAAGLRVHWAGFRNQSELPLAYAAADCLALPSGSETWGLVVNEALASGIPCVVSDAVGCAPDLIVPGVTGERVPVGDIPGLAAALARVARASAAGHDWSADCRRRAAAYSVEAATTGLLAACQRVSGRQGREPMPREAATLLVGTGMVIPGGLERETFEVLRVLRQHGAPVHCLLNAWENEPIAALAESIGASWSSGHDGGTLALPKGVLELLGMVLGNARASWDVLSTALRVRPQAVLVPEMLIAARIAPTLLALRLAGKRIILRMGVAPPLGERYRRAARYLIDPCVDRFVCNSEFTAGEVLRLGIAPDKIEVITNVAPTRVADAPGIPRDERRVIFVGQIIPPKGLDVLLDAIGLLVDRGLAPSLDVVGQHDGWESPAYAGFKARVKARAAQVDLRERVRFLGFREDVPRLMASAAVHCCPSLPEQREAFGLVVVEAKEAATPSVVFPVGALPSLVSHGSDGWICPEPTAAALADGLAYFLSEPARAREAGRAARASAARFDHREFAERWGVLFRAGHAVQP